jgi:hypothetical protein
MARNCYRAVLLLLLTGPFFHRHSGLEGGKRGIGMYILLNAWLANTLIARHI